MMYDQNGMQSFVQCMEIFIFFFLCDRNAV